MSFIYGCLSVFMVAYHLKLPIKKIELVFDQIRSWLLNTYFSIFHIHNPAAELGRN